MVLRVFAFFFLTPHCPERLPSSSVTLCACACVCLGAPVCAMRIGMLWGSSTTGHWDNQSLDCRSGTCTVGTIHLNPAAAGKGGRRNETREKRIGEEKGTERERERESERERDRRGRPGREKSQGEAVKVKRANTEWVGGGGGVFVGRLYVVICVTKVHAQGQFGWAESSWGHNLALCTLTR